MPLAAFPQQCWIDNGKNAALLPALSSSSSKLLTTQRAANLAIRHLLPTPVGASGSSQMIGLAESQLIRRQRRWSVEQVEQVAEWEAAPPLVMRGGTNPPRHQGGPHPTHPIKTGSTFEDFANIPPRYLKSVRFRWIKTALNFPHSGMRAEEIYWNGKAVKL